MNLKSSGGIYNLKVDACVNFRKKALAFFTFLQEKKFFFSVPDETRLCFPNGKIRTGREDAHAVKMGINMMDFPPHRARVAFGNSCCLCEWLTFYWLAGASFS